MWNDLFSLWMIWVLDDLIDVGHRRESGSENVNDPIRCQVEVSHNLILTLYLPFRVVSLLLCYYSNKTIKCSQTNISNYVSPGTYWIVCQSPYKWTVYSIVLFNYIEWTQQEARPVKTALGASNCEVSVSWLHNGVAANLFPPFSFKKQNNAAATPTPLNPVSTMKIICRLRASTFINDLAFDGLARERYPACQRPSWRPHVWTPCVFACAPVPMAVRFSSSSSVSNRCHQRYLPKLTPCQFATLFS